MDTPHDRSLEAREAAPISMPVVIETTHKGERAFDIFSRLMRDRIIYLGTPVNDTVANIIVAQLLFLDNEDPKREISMFVNSPGGSVTAGLAIYDTMQFIRAPVSTVCMGMAASMAAVLLAAGAKGRRLILPNAEVMIHQPLGGAMGQATDIEIHAKRIVRMKERLNGILVTHTGQPMDKIKADTERDRFLEAEAAVAYGLVDEIVAKRPDAEP